MKIIGSKRGGLDRSTIPWQNKGHLEPKENLKRAEIVPDIKPDFRRFC